MKKRIFALLLALILLLPLLIACGGNTSGDSPANADNLLVNETKQNPLETLNEKERELYETILKNIYTLDNRENIRLLIIHETSYENTINWWYLKIETKNKNNENYTKWYILYAEKGIGYCVGFAGFAEKKDLSEMRGSNGYDVEKINEALKYYWEHLDPNPIEKLNYKERKLFDMIMKYIDVFYNPQDVRLMEIMEVNFIKDEIEDIDYELKITSTNRSGGSDTKWYMLKNNPATNVYINGEYINRVHRSGVTGFKEIEEDYFFTLYGSKNDEYNVKNINDALKYHWAELGLD